MCPVAWLREPQSADHVVVAGSGSAAVVSGRAALRARRAGTEKERQHGTQWRRHRRALPGRRRRGTRFRLPWRRGALHLRRDFQGRTNSSTFSGASRAGCRARRRRVLARLAESGRMPVDQRSGRHQCRHRHRHRLHGLHPHGHHQRPGADCGHRRGCLPGMRHRGHHASLRQAQLPGARRQGPAGTMRRAFFIARTGRPGPVLVDIEGHHRRAVQVRAAQGRDLDARTRR